ncbi:uncharacterized protein MONOS_4557 [Monocercomonoides exilis]|uniref:uncharacterized protein n=1 Tax=Monocercomonoides exilis TaxID=2049356 RepID=UPI003559640D|nr:hypothetical protein MONOS_4557 [Monocercomonoides exilis]|eukprot:MONOS_4557.1-p1 / transcript=MONOS_4557.1 / gene=MONOS_4557 / organism=Monocercomonoides_exilis_PA203 / gene_product=unspecified product / transcript_product=unspecified product / location=Mono_scaffold00122:66997-68672(-) / protein_length=434 / sequence_SO=supercontig / SO=protein_coding / is_pseudo=false
MVRSMKQTQRRRTPTIMAKRRYLSPSTDSTNSPNDFKSNRGKCTCSSSDARLERADMGTTDKNVETLRMEMERTEPGFEGWKMDETDGSKSPAKQNENSSHQSLESQGEKWFRKMLVSKGYSVREIDEYNYFIAESMAICACMLFSACRFTELERINLQNSTIGDNSIKLDSSLKTSTERTNIIIPFLKEQPLVCQAASEKELWNRIKESQPNTTSLFIDEKTHLALSARRIRNYAAEMLQDAGIPKCFGPYSLKHASITALTMAGIPLAQIAKFARLSPRSNTITKHYVQSDVSSKLAHVIARCNSTVLQPEKSGSASESDSDSEAESDSETNTSSNSEEQTPTKEICENGDRKQQTEFAFPDKVEEPEDNEENNASQTVISEAKIEFIICTRSQRRKEMEKKQHEEKNICSSLLTLSNLPNYLCSQKYKGRK